MKTIKEFVLNLFSAPKGTPIRSQRYYVATNSIYVLAGCIHFLFIFFFALVRAPEMMFFNMGSVLWFGFAIWINRKGFLITSLYLCFIEVYAHAAAATYFFGWGAGYQYYALLFSTGIFLLPPGRTIQKFISILVGVFIFGGIYYYTVFNEPVYAWKSPWVDIINASNMIFSSLFHAGFAYYFTWSANQAEDSLEKEHKARTAFFQNISHELRTPLTLISGPSEIAYRKNENLSPEDLKMVVSNSRRLTRLVNQLLDIQKISYGKIQLKKVNFDLIPFLKNILGSFETYATKKGIQLECHFSLPSMVVHADPEQIDKCIYNYLSNALKFTPQGGKITVSVQIEPGKDSVILEVRDTGVGINPEQISRLFSRFGISTASLTREQEGTGLGLSIVKEIIELHSGEVGCKSNEGIGSVFFFTLPKSPETAVLSSPEYDSPFFQEEIEEEIIDQPSTFPKSVDTSGEANRFYQSHILIVEDNRDLRSYIGSILTRRGFMTSVAVDGQEGIAKAFSSKPDLILTDLMMPKKSGLDLISEIRSSPDLKGIPIVLLTAKADDSTRRETITEGANAYLPKPFHDEELIQVIVNLLELKSVEKELIHEAGKLSGLQEKLLPPVPKDWKGMELELLYQPSHHFSGDYYFFRRINNHQFQVLLFDISGHGITTSLVLGMLHLLITHSTTEDPGELLEELNAKLYSHTSGYFITGIALKIDSKESILQFSKAGHPDPILIQQKKARHLNLTGKPLGIYPKIEMETISLPYQTGDQLLIYTDGISEIKNKEQEYWESNQLFLKTIEKASVSKKNFPETILEEARSFQNHSQFEDDATLISITFA